MTDTEIPSKREGKWPATDPQLLSAANIRRDAREGHLRALWPTARKAWLKIAPAAMQWEWEYELFVRYEDRVESGGIVLERWA